jgi:hypothetical protein
VTDRPRRRTDMIIGDRRRAHFRDQEAAGAGHAWVTGEPLFRAVIAPDVVASGSRHTHSHATLAPEGRGATRALPLGGSSDISG